MKFSLKNIIVPQIPTAILLVSSCLLMWVIAYWGGSASKPVPSNNIIIKFLQTFITPRTLISDIYSVSFTLLNAYLIAQINNRFTIIRTRTFLPILIFLILMCTWDETHEANGSHISLTFIILSLFNFMGMYRDKKSSEKAFLGSLFIGLSSMINNPIIFIVPVCWIGFSIFQSISLRTILASVLGVISPWILYLSGLYYFNSVADFQHTFTSGFSLQPELLSLPLNRLIYLISILTVLGICIVGMISITSGDVIRTRNNLYFILLLLISVFFIALFYENQLTKLLPIIAMFYAIVVSHPFTLRLNKFYGILFVLFWVINVAFIASKFIIL